MYILYILYYYFPLLKIAFVLFYFYISMQLLENLKLYMMMSQGLLKENEKRAELVGSGSFRLL